MGGSQSSCTTFHQQYSSGRFTEENVQALLRSGASPNALNSSKTPVLCLAAQDDNLPVVKLLLKYGADPLQRCPRGRHAQMHAIGYKHEEVSLWLVMQVPEYKNIVFQKDKNKKDILHLTARKDMVNVAIYVLIGIYSQGYPVELGRPMITQLSQSAYNYNEHIRKISKSSDVDYIQKLCSNGIRGVLSGVFPHSTVETFLYHMRSPLHTDMLISPTSPLLEGWSNTLDNLSSVFAHKDGKNKKSRILLQLFKARIHDMGLCVRLLDTYTGKRVVLEPYSIYTGDTITHQTAMHTGHAFIPLLFDDVHPLIMDIRVQYLSLTQLFICKDTFCYCNTRQRSLSNHNNSSLQQGPITSTVSNSSNSSNSGNYNTHTNNTKYDATLPPSYEETSHANTKNQTRPRRNSRILMEQENVCSTFPPVLPYITLPRHMLTSEVDETTCYVHDQEDQKAVKMSLCSTRDDKITEVSLDVVYKHTRIKQKYNVDIPKYNGVPGFVVLQEYENGHLDQIKELSNIAASHIINPMLQSSTFPAIHCIEEPVTLPGVCTELSASIPELSKYYSFTGSCLSGRVHPKENMCTCLSRKTVDKELTDMPVRIRQTPDRSAIAVKSLQKDFSFESYAQNTSDGELLLYLDSSFRVGGSTKEVCTLENTRLAAPDHNNRNTKKQASPEQNKPYLVCSNDTVSVRIKVPSELTNNIAYNLDIVANARSMCRKALYTSAHFFTVYQQYIQLIVHTRIQGTMYKRIVPLLHEYFVHMRVCEYMSSIRRVHTTTYSTQAQSIATFLKTQVLSLLKAKPKSVFSPLLLGQKVAALYEHTLPMNLPTPVSPLDHPKFLAAYEQYSASLMQAIEPQKVYGNCGIYHIFENMYPTPPLVPLFQNSVTFVDTVNNLQTSLTQYTDSASACMEVIHSTMPAGAMKVNAIEAMQVQMDKIAGVILTVEKFMNWLLLHTSGNELNAFPCCGELQMTKKRVCFIPTPGMNTQSVNVDMYISVKRGMSTSSVSPNSNNGNPHVLPRVIVTNTENRMVDPNQVDIDWRDKVTVLPPMRTNVQTPSPSDNKNDCNSPMEVPYFDYRDIQPVTRSNSHSRSNTKREDLDTPTVVLPPYSY